MNGSDPPAAEEETLPAEVWATLVRVAEGMLKDQAMSRSFDAPEVSGRLNTEFTVETRDGASTIQFLAEIETAEGEYELAFDLVVEVDRREVQPERDVPFTVWNHSRGGPLN